MKRVVAEMGGKDCIIVDSEADVEDAAKGVVASAFGFQGQKCSACSRAIVDDSVYNKFVKLLKEEVDKLEIGAAEENHKMTPVISASAEKTILSYIEIGKQEGRLLTGGKKADGNGYFIKPTVFIDVKPTARIAQEEIFGPVLCAMPFEDEDHAVELANATRFGLVAGVWTHDGARQFRMARRIRSGQVFINNYGAGGGIELPFGGVKSSGYGREKGFEALYGFTTLKTVAFHHG